MSLMHLPETHRRELLTFVQSFAEDRAPDSAQTTALTAEVLRVVRLSRELNDILLGLAQRANITPNRIIAEALRNYFLEPAGSALDGGRTPGPRTS